MPRVGFGSRGCQHRGQLAAKMAGNITVYTGKEKGKYSLSLASFEFHIYIVLQKVLRPIVRETQTPTIFYCF